MYWINKNKQVLRAILLSLLSLAIMGPWSFDVINVPAEYTCHAPNIRLYGDFCGVPLSGLMLLSWMVSGFILPFFSTLLLILRGDRHRLQIFNLVAWGLALGLCLLMGLSNYPHLFWVLWGIWLYIGVAVSALVLEILVLVAGRSNSTSV